MGRKPILFVEDAGSMLFMFKKEDVLPVDSANQKKYVITTGLKTDKMIVSQKNPKEIYSVFNILDNNPI